VFVGLHEGPFQTALRDCTDCVGLGDGGGGGCRVHVQVWEDLVAR